MLPRIDCFESTFALGPLLRRRRVSQVWPFVTQKHFPATSGPNVLVLLAVDKGGGPTPPHSLSPPPRVQNPHPHDTSVPLRVCPPPPSSRQRGGETTSASAKSTWAQGDAGRRPPTRCTAERRTAPPPPPKTPKTTPHAIARGGGGGALGPEPLGALVPGRDMDIERAVGGQWAGGADCPKGQRYAMHRCGGRRRGSFTPAHSPPPPFVPLRGCLQWPFFLGRGAVVHRARPPTAPPPPSRRSPPLLCAGVPPEQGAAGAQVGLPVVHRGARPERSVRCAVQCSGLGPQRLAGGLWGPPGGHTDAGARGRAAGGIPSPPPPPPHTRLSPFGGLGLVRG